MRFAKGHGTGNDFVLLPDLDDRLALDAPTVRALCDRHAGLGADGILRIVRSGDGSAPWFMDYRNADGSLAEMCGNGIRVFARYLLDHGLADGPELRIETRGGVRAVRAEPDGTLTVDMGPAVPGPAGQVVAGGRTFTGLAVSVGNPHLACLTAGPLEEIDLSVPPQVDLAAFPDGVNVEFVAPAGQHAIAMRVHERGSGETMSCGTGAVAAAVAAAVASGEWDSGRDGGASAARRWTVELAGGRLAVTPSATASLLTGPAVIVAEGEVAASWLDDHRTRASAVS
ncbi:MAG TPA: diaminopimelate epimerase [Streptosporangiaceae bacterium]